MRRSAWIGIVCLALAIISIIVIAICKLRGQSEHETLSELLLVFVLGVEGIVAVVHLEQERLHSQTEALSQAMIELGSDVALKDAYLIHLNCFARKDNVHDFGGDPLVWEYDNSQRPVTYTVTRGDGSTATVIVDINNHLWAAINRVIERYQRIGLLLDHGRIAREEFLQWGHIPVIRMWQRLGSLVLKERERRPLPNLWRYFETFNILAMKYHRSITRNGNDARVVIDKTA